jgi:Pyruvate/2-oxoacid:ferredoxin oxidoreductase delta subunit
MKRKIITIDEEKCNGCGNCTTGCAEGALQIVNGKAKMVKEQFCDGFGDCIGTCPTGALKIEERDAPEFDVQATKQHLMKTQGIDAVRRMEAAAVRHEAKADSHARAPSPAAAHAHAHAMGGCPGSRMRFNPKGAETPAPASSGSGLPGKVNKSELNQWPVQLHLVQPGAPFFANRELVVLRTCSPIASADVHWRFIRGRGVVVACPKLDDTESYAEKLAAILSEPSIPKVTVVRMEVPCCGGLTHIVREALGTCNRTDLQAEEVTVSLDGEVVATEPITA